MRCFIRQLYAHREAKKGSEHFPCNGAYYAANDLGFAEPSFQSPRRRGLGLFALTKAAYNNDTESLALAWRLVSVIEVISPGLPNTRAMG